MEYPLLISAWLNVVFGHFAMASVLTDDLESDPLEERNCASYDLYAKVRQTLRDVLLERIIEQDYPHTLRDNRVMGLP